MHRAGALFVSLIVSAALPGEGAAAADRHCGVCWVGGRPVGAEDLQPLVENGVEWIVQTPFGWQRTHDSPRLFLVTEGNVLWGESDEGLVVTARLARERSIRTMLKPHIWITRPVDGQWRAEIAMSSEEDWAAWFADYRRFIVHYARLAQREGLDGLCIGTELASTVHREEDWRSIIAAVREEYDGPLTYGANWYREFEDVRFWDALDYIGVQAYFPLTERENPSVAELVDGWEKHLPGIEAVSEREGKRVLFTEIGYKSTPDGAVEPWIWPQQQAPSARKVSVEAQANAYEAFFRAVWDRDWFGGSYIWKWFPPHDRAGGPDHFGFTPQNKPAQQILRAWYTR